MTVLLIVGMSLWVAWRWVSRSLSFRTYAYVRHYEGKRLTRAQCKRIIAERRDLDALLRSGGF